MPNQPGFLRTSTLRPYVAVLIAALALLLLSEVAVRAWVGVADPEQVRWYDASTQIRAEGFNETGTRPVVFAGTSMSWQGFVPSEFSSTDSLGRSAFNAGLAGGVPKVTEPWLLNHVVPALEPDVVIWGLGSLDFSSSYGEANYEIWSQAPASRPGALGALERNLAGTSNLIKWRTVLREPSSWIGESGDQAAADIAAAQAILGADGERRDFEFDVSRRRAAVQQARLADPTPDTADVAAVLRTIDALQAQGIEVVLVQLPVPVRFIELHPNGVADVERTRSLIDAIGEDTSSRVIDLSDGFTDSDFVDFTHLTEAGARRLTERLATRLG